MRLQADGDQTGIAPLGASPPLDQRDAPIRRYETSVHRVDPILGEWLQESFDGGCHEEVDIVLRHLSLEVELDAADTTAEQLRMQRRESLGQIGERSHERELLGGERRS